MAAFIILTVIEAIALIAVFCKHGSRIEDVYELYLRTWDDKDI